MVGRGYAATLGIEGEVDMVLLSELLESISLSLRSTGDTIYGNLVNGSLIVCDGGCGNVCTTLEFDIGCGGSKVGTVMSVGGGATVGNTTICLVGRVYGCGCLVDWLVFEICTVYTHVLKSPKYSNLTNLLKYSVNQIG